jgi:hypothetical protein
MGKLILMPTMDALIFEYILHADEKALRLLIDDYNAGIMTPRFMVAMDAVESLADENAGL